MQKKIIYLIIPIVVALFNILIIFYPADVMESAKEGCLLWFNNVLPSLLPFFIGTNLLIGLGAVDFLGTLLEPAMRPLFGVPGCGGFALVMGMTSGYPVGAKIIASLCESGKISKTEAQRLMSFVNNSGPLFMVGALGAGMFANKNIGYFILISNFSAAIITGFLFKYYRFEREAKSHSIKKKKPFKTAVAAMIKARQDDGRPFGKLLSDSVINSMESILTIAGFIILFCVIIRVVETIGVLNLLSKPLISIGLIESKTLANGIIYGIIEVTGGANKLSAYGVSRNIIIICASLVSFGGISIFSQSVAFLSKTKVSTGVYFISKIINAALTAIIGLFIYPFFDFNTTMEATTAFAVSPIRQLMVYTIIYSIVLISVVITAIAINISIFLKEGRGDI